MFKSNNDYNFFYLDADLFRITKEENKLHKYLKRVNLDKTNVINISGSLTKNDFSPWYDRKPDLFYQVENIFKIYKDKKFILLSSLENLESYFDSKNLLYVYSTGDQTVNLIHKHVSLVPTLNKNFNTVLPNIISSNMLKVHETIAISLAGNFFTIYSNLKKFDDFRWRLEGNAVKNIQEKIKELKVLSFDNFHGGKYRDSFLELVIEDHFCEDCFFLSEKTISNILGCNFPVWIAPKGFVNYLRSIGIDVFDDIINHSYDQISNPYKRIEQALLMNSSLIQNFELVKKLWQINKSRFLINWEHLSKNVYTQYSNSLCRLSKHLLPL